MGSESSVDVEQIISDMVKSLGPFPVLDNFIAVFGEGFHPALNEGATLFVDPLKAHHDWPKAR